MYNVERRFEKIFDFTDRNNCAIAAVSHPQFKGPWLPCFPQNEQKIVYDCFTQAVSQEKNKDSSDTSVSNYEDDFDFGGDDGIISEFKTSSDQADIEVEVIRYLKSTNSK